MFNLQIFLDILPEISAQRRLSIILYLLRYHFIKTFSMFRIHSILHLLCCTCSFGSYRILGEHGSLAPLLSLLFRSLMTKKDLSQSVTIMVSSSEFMSVIEEWEYGFALQVTDHYSSVVWLPSLAILLQRIGGLSLSRELFMELLLVMHFISQKLQDPELTMNLDTGENSEKIQVLDL